MTRTNTATRVGGVETGSPLFVKVADLWVNPYSVASITPIADSESRIVFMSGQPVDVNLPANSVVYLLSDQAIETPARYQFVGGGEEGDGQHRR
ncbi:hypothetical protein [Microbacterium sp. LMI1x-1-1.1]|uniref:hypothetical protein n=1 Tax=Microbacterium sp. LMI1x-1-1.1 TaxID=3135246 RepID=UPI00342D1CA2